MAGPTKIPLSKMAVLARYRDGGILEECLTVLVQHQIPYRIETTAPVFEVTSIGSAGANHEAILLVESSQLGNAQQVLLEDARATIKLVPPEADDYLATLHTPDLQRMLQEPEGWSFHDLAAAEALLQQRAAEVPPITYRDQSAPPKDYDPVRVRLPLVVFGALATGGIYGIVIALSLIFSRQHGSDSPYHYDEFSRRVGWVILILTLIAWSVSVSLIWNSIISPSFGGGSRQFFHVE